MGDDIGGGSGIGPVAGTSSGLDGVVVTLSAGVSIPDDFSLEANRKRRGQAAEFGIGFN
jgi:hypothetical protein